LRRQWFFKTKSSDGPYHKRGGLASIEEDIKENYRQGQLTSAWPIEQGGATEKRVGES